jgi:hypothetical protein
MYVHSCVRTYERMDRAIYVWLVDGAEDWATGCVSCGWTSKP